MIGSWAHERGKGKERSQININEGTRREEATIIKRGKEEKVCAHAHQRVGTLLSPPGFSQARSVRALRPLSCACAQVSAPHGGGAPGAFASRSAPRVRKAAGSSGCRRAGESACQPLGLCSRWPSPSPAFGAGAVEPAPRVPRWGRSGDGGSSGVSEPEREWPRGGHGRPSPSPQPGRHRPVRPAGPCRNL